MKKIIVLLIFVGVFVGLMFFILRDNSSEERATRNVVGATIFPLYDIARIIAGDEFKVVLLLPPGASPHTFDPQPRLVRDMEGAQTVFVIGHGLDEWSSALAQSLNIPITVVDENITLRESIDAIHNDEGDGHGHDEDGHDAYSEEDEHHDEHDHGPVDPHYWLSITNAEQIALNIADRFSELDPENADVYMSRAEQYGEELRTFSNEIQPQLSTLSQRNIVALHDAWYYFADELNLNIVGVFESSAGREPTPKWIEALAEEIEEYEVDVLFAEPQLSFDSIRAFAQDEGLEVAFIDPIGGVEGRESYIDLMRYNVESVMRALGAK